MIVKIHGTDTFIPVSTVTIYKQAAGQTNPFHCRSCGNTTNVIEGKVSRIYPILEPSDQVVVITTCRSCKAKYTFQEAPPPQDPTIIVRLNPTSTMQYFYCYVGGGATKEENRILEYNTNNVYSYSNHSYVDFPYSTRCPNPTCSALYQFI